MPVRTLTPTGDQVIREEYHAVGTNRICYPGVIRCITITGYHSSRLIGCHITEVTTADEINALFDGLKGDGGNWCQYWYVVGNITSFKKHTSVQAFKSRKLMREYIQEKFSTTAQVLFFDTSMVQEADIFAVKSPSGVDFSIRDGSNTTVLGFTYPTNPSATHIAASHFQQR